MKKFSKILTILLLCSFLSSSLKFAPVTQDRELSSQYELLADYNELYGIEPKQTSKPLSADAKSQNKVLKYLAVFIEFLDSDTMTSNHLDDKQSVENAKKLFNSPDFFEMDTINGKIEVPSFKKYYEMQSYGKLSITTEIFPRVNGEVVSYRDSHPVGYYMPYSDSNQIGYKDKTESMNRETELVNSAIAFVSNEIDAAGIAESEVDTDSNGIIDAISFFIEGQDVLSASISWGDLLWSHKLDNYGLSSKILGKQVISYNLLYTYDYTEAAGLFSLNRGTYGTIMHEYGHTLGLFDLYRFDHSGSTPVGFYDLMGQSSGSNPSDLLTYFTTEYSSMLAWHDPLPVIDKSTTNITVQKPKYLDDSEQRAIKIQPDKSSKEFFIVEYHEKKNTYSSYSADESGLIVYRVNDNNKYQGDKEGGDHGELDHIFIYRPEEPFLGAGAGKLSQATLNMNRKTLGKALDPSVTTFDNKSIYYSNGTNSGVVIEVIAETADSITFNVTLPSLAGSGTKQDPYLIKTPDDFIYFMKLDTSGKYYKLTSDLDFANMTYPSINFKGNLDGNGKKLKNIVSSTGVFDDLGDYSTHSKIENIYIENITVQSTKGSYLGGFASTTANVTIENVHLTSGSVKNAKDLFDNSLASTGGFVGNASSDTTIRNCSSALSVEAPRSVGGFIGLNSNSLIENCFTTGSVKGDLYVGSFIAQQYITDSSYKIPKNAYYIINTSIPSVGTYANQLHNTSALDPSNLGIGLVGISTQDKMIISINETKRLELTTYPSTTLSYDLSVEDTLIASVSNNVIRGLAKGSTTIYTNIHVGTNIMRLSTTLTVRDETVQITEEEVLNYLGLTKKEGYLVGFTLGDSVQNVKNMLSSFDGVTLQKFQDATGTEITSGIIATGMKFALEIDNVVYDYTVVIKGDANGDGLIYATDYVKIKNQIMGRPTLQGAYYLAADIDNDGNIYATDYVKIKNYIMGRGEIPQK